MKFNPFRSLASAFSGLSAPLRGFGYMAKRPRLWRHIVFPVLINLLLTGLLVALAVVFAPKGIAWIEARFAGGWVDTLLKWLAYLASLLVMLGLTAGFWLLAQGVLCAWFYTNLAKEVELDLGLDPQWIKDPPLMREIFESVRSASLVAVVSLTCLVLGLIPVVGMVAAAAAFYFNSMVFAVEYYSYPMALRGQGLREQKVFAKLHRPHSLGFGAGITFLAFLPIINSVLLATAVTGAVLLHRDLQNA